MILTLSSTNPKFSHVILKNPETIKNSKKPFERKLRKGKIFGWFTDQEGQSFRLWFRDSDIDTSFGNENYEYLDKTRYSHPQAVLSIITEALHTCATKRQEDDVDGFEAKLSFPAEVKISVVNRLIAMFGETCLQAENLNDSDWGPWTFTITTPTVYEALNVANVISVLGAIADPDCFISMKEEPVRKYLRALLAAKAPYHIWHQFAKKAITSRGLYAKVRGDLDKSGFVLNYGNTQIHRMDAISSRLLVPGKSDTLLDIGCGELTPALKIGAENYNTVYAVDSNEEISKANINRLARKEINNVVMMHATASPQWVKENEGLVQNSDVLLTEVLEHMPKTEAKKLLVALLAAKPNKIVCTVPNRSFNKYYGLEGDEKRHSDHDWEPNEEEIANFVTDVACDAQIDELVLHLPRTIGDIVDRTGATFLFEFHSPKGQ